LARGFDTEVVGTSDDSEVTTFTIVRTPGVSNHPVLNSLFNTVTNDGNSMVEFSGTRLVVDDTAGIVKDTSGIKSADDGTSLVDFVDHIGFALNVTEFSELVNGISGGNDALATGVAVLALDHGITANSGIPTLSLVVRAGFVGNGVVEDVFHGNSGVTTVASFVFTLVARQQDLRSQFKIGPLSLSGDLDSVSNGRGGGESPAGSAVLGNVLVSDKGQIVDTIDITPEPLIRDGTHVKGLKRSVNLRRKFFIRHVFVSLVEGQGSAHKDGQENNSELVHYLSRLYFEIISN